MATGADSSLHLRGGTIEDGAGYNPNFTRSSILFNDGGGGTRPRPRPRRAGRRQTDHSGSQSSSPFPSGSRSSLFHSRSRSRSSSRPSESKSKSQSRSRTRSRTRPRKLSAPQEPRVVGDGGEYEAVPRDVLYEARAEKLGIRDSLLRPATGPGGADPTAGSRLSEWWRALFRGGGRGRRRRLDELTRGEWRPTRARFEISWPEAEMESDWYEMVFTHLYVRVAKFVGEYFGHEDLWDLVPEGPVGSAGGSDGDGGGGGGRRGKSVWLDAGFSKQFLWFVEKVAMQDNNVGTWDDLLVRRLQRECLITGVIAKALETCVFDDLLFGADEVQKRMLDAQDECTLEREGYQRTRLRSHCVRSVLLDNVLTPDFWPCVDQLTLRLTSMLLPLLHLMDDRFPASREKSLRSFYQDLHAIVAEAGFLSIGMRWSSHIFRITFPYPSEPWDLDQEHADEAVWNYSQAASDRAEKAAEEKWREARRRQQEEAANPASPTIRTRARAVITSAIKSLETVQRRMAGRASEEGRDEQDAAAEVWQPGSRLAKVQIVLWPLLQRFEAVGEIDPETGAAEGENIATLFKSRVVYYAGRTGGSLGRNELYPSLKVWMRKRKREYLWGLVLRLRWLVYAAAAWLLLLFLARFSTVVDGVRQVIQHGFLAVAKYVLRESLLLVIEVLISILAMAIGISKVVLFCAYAVRNAINGLLTYGQRLVFDVLRLREGGGGWADASRGRTALAYPDLSWASMKGMARAVAGEVVWRTFTVSIPTGYTRTYSPETPAPTL